MSSPKDDEGSPLDEGLPVWSSVTEEKDYWKRLALEYGAKLSALKHTMQASWMVQQDHEGEWWIVQDGGAAGDGVVRRAPLASLEAAMRQLNLKLD